MRVAYIANLDLPNRYAHALQVMKNAQAWSQVSSSFEFITKISLKNVGSIDFTSLAEFYGLTHRFPIKAYPLRYLDRSRWHSLQTLFFRLAARRCKRKKVDLVFTRCRMLPRFTLALGIPTIAETHGPPSNNRDKMSLYSQMSHPDFLAMVTISEELASRYRDFGLPSEKIIVLPDGVDMERFSRPLSKEAARTMLNLPADKATVVYAGHLYDGRGIEDILTAADELSDIEFLLVGGHDADVERWKERTRTAALSNVTLTGFINNCDLPPYLWAADVLLMPYSIKCPTAQWMSPLKLFEYMAAGRPVIASELPAVKTVITHGRNAWLSPPDDGKALARAISSLVHSQDLCSRLAHQAYQDVHQYSWENRVKKILNYINHEAARNHI